MNMSDENRKRLKKATLAITAILCLLVLADRVLFPLPEEILARAPAHLVYSREGDLMGAYSSSDRFWRIPVVYEQISPRLIETVLFMEDRWFYYHPGINPISLVSALWDNLKAGEVVRGGSTITMQIARMMDPKPRTLKNKLIEIARAFQLETRYSKHELLEIYFNLAPYGGNIEGIGAACHFYFGKSPAELTYPEAAVLTAIPASPNDFRPDLEPQKCRARRNFILKLLADNKTISHSRLGQFIAEELPLTRQPRPQTARHLCQTVISECPNRSKITTTLDTDIQATCERLAENYHNLLVERDIHNLSIVVLDNHTGDLLAMVGSPDFNDRSHHGQVNGALAKRSPGSALKPFAYALGFEEGLITPADLLDDIPVSYAGYAPENYDEKYHGVVDVRTALIQSLNVPAVNLVARMGLRKYHDFLTTGNLLEDERGYLSYGLPLVLGACEVSLYELSNLYSTLARGGIYRPVRMILNHAESDDTALLSKQSTYLVSEILRELNRPNLNTSWEFTRDRPAIAWKTGTSYGRRDAWAIGYNPKYTVGVWAGNFSGEGSPWLVGAETAAPLMFAIFDQITLGEEPQWFKRPEGIGVRQVCALSGMPPGPHCQKTKTALYIEKVSDNMTCPLHGQILVDRESGHRLSRDCTYGHDYDSLVVELWPARLANWFTRHNLLKPLPEFAPECLGTRQSDRPVILSPEPETVFELVDHIPAEYQQIPLKASVSLDSREIHWFIDEKLYASVKNGEKIFYRPKTGRHSLVCVDDLGRSSRIEFEVK
ncbi:MAG: penicillin-binding protein 1C [candidate division Zixibacteria bacterium]|nr:penicillin-binding protein 1C [candidate division Zixibacteria bacterium]